MLRLKLGSHGLLQYSTTIALWFVLSVMVCFLELQIPLLRAKYCFLPSLFEKIEKSNPGAGMGFCVEVRFPTLFRV
jgi:hypothetical protein